MSANVALQHQISWHDHGMRRRWEDVTMTPSLPLIMMLLLLRLHSSQAGFTFLVL
jgi:hypothetical protein